MKKQPAYGTKTDYPKIDIFVGNRGCYAYRASTTWARTCKEAAERFTAQTGLAARAWFAKK